ncbi:MAG: hypothetical protein LRY37_03430 [Alkalibacterium thalassium]|nr:hypothetical protein [Alkalibacterium thalassium]
MKQKKTSSSKVRLFKPSFYIKLIGVSAGVLVLYYLAIRQTNASLARMLSAFPIFFRMLTEDFFPPDFGYFPTVVNQLIETFNIALISTTLAAVLAFPLLFFFLIDIEQTPVILRRDASCPDHRPVDPEHYNGRTHGSRCRFRVGIRYSGTHDLLGSNPN